MYPLAHRERRASRRGIRDARIAFCRTAGGSYGKLEGRRQKLEGESAALQGPEEVEFFLDAGEIFVAGGEGGFAVGKARN